MKSYINRNIYLSKVSPYIGKQIIKFFTGQRRVGKSYMLYQVMDEILRRNPKQNIIYIDKEKVDFDFIQKYNDLVSYIKSNSRSGENAIFIDEIQDIKDFEKALRSLYTEPGYDIYCTGSNANLLSGELATYLSGRYIEINIYALSYTEFLEFHRLEDSRISLQNYLNIGGLPNLIHLPKNDDIIFDYLKNIYASILFRDIIKRYNIRNVSFLENLVVYLAENLGSIVSGKRISDFLKSQNIKISPNVVLDYLSYLCSSFFVYRTRRKDIIGKKIFEIGDKYYFEDLGLRNSIIGIKTTDIHKIIENAVFSHLKVKNYDIKIGAIGAKEIDFVAEKGGEQVYIQCCYLLQDEKTVDREFGNLLNIPDNYRKIVVSMDDFESKNTFKGIQHMQLQEFLTNF